MDGPMKQVRIFLAFSVSMMLSACLGEDSSKSAQQGTSDKVAAQVEFVSPVDGLLSPERAKLYSDASAALLLLSQQWIDRMDKAADAQEKILILGGLEKARDQVCRKVGLLGVKEYNWISEVALKNPANRAIAEKAGILLSAK